jgi:hypothetical protein
MSDKILSPRKDERGAALATAILMLALMSAIAMTVLAVVQTETRVAGSDLERTQAFYAAAAGIEKMTSDFSSLFGRTSRPTVTQLNNIAGSPPDLAGEGFTFSQSIALDTARLAEMRATQGITNGAYPHVAIPDGPFAGLTASVAPFNLESTATSPSAQVTLKRDMNNYLIPLFQFGMFSDEDIELHPGPAFAFNGRVHANGNIYVNGNVTFLAKVTAANEFITDVLRNGSVRTGANVRMKVGSITVSATKGSMNDGPNIPGANAGERGYFPTSPNGTINSTWNTTSVAAAASGVPNRFGGQLLTRTTGASPLKLPLQLDGNPTREIIKRRMPNDSITLSESRYHSKAEIRILIEDEGLTNDASRIAASQNGDGTNNAGVNLSTFTPMPLPNAAAPTGGRALWRISDAGAYVDTSSTCVNQMPAPSPSPTPTPMQAVTVRGVKATSETVTLNGQNVRIPGGSGLTGKILIQIVDPNGVARDVTTEILSMGMTFGEPNAIVMLQRPLWAAFTQGSRDRTSSTATNHLDYLVNSSYLAADGEIKIGSSNPSMNTTYGYLTAIADEHTGQPTRDHTPPSNAMSNLMTGTPGANWAAWNAIVPINLYNPREGHLKTSVSHNAVYERGITSVIELNMKNLARWMDGVYDQNLLAGTPAVSTNIGKPDGYIVYISDRRGDRVRSMVDSSGATIVSSNGMVDNADIYGPNGVLDPGEDVQGTGTLVKDTAECPDPVALVTSPSYGTDRIKRAVAVAAWTNPSNYFRRSVRLFDGEDLVLSGASNKLSATLGITVASENLTYIWGNYNTTGINVAPASGVASLNESSSASRYNGDQVPASIVCDAFFPLSKTWFDSSGAVRPDVYSDRRADAGLPGVTHETSVRAGIIAGNNLSALMGDPDAENNADSRLSGGMHNFPRFLEDWLSDDRRWNFVGSFVPLYRSTQALGPWWYITDIGPVNVGIYGAPIRNWAFDATFQQPDRLPPGTPQFQYIQPTAFRQDL